MSDLKGLLEGEYNNSADLLGADDGAELLGRISKLPKDQQGKALKNLLKRGGGGYGNGTSRHEIEQRFSQLPDVIRQGLINKRLQLSDTRFYVVKDIAGKNSIDIFQGTDQKGVGLGNLANQKLEKDNWFILYAIRMTYAENAGGKESADFTHIHPVVRNGEFELEAGNKKIISTTENSCFDTKDRQDIQVGFYKLENAKIIEPQTEIKMPVKFAAAANANAFLKVVFVGTSVIPF